MEPSLQFVEYVTIEPISRGATAAVYLGRSTTTGARVALKLFPAGPEAGESGSTAETVSRHFDTELGILLDSSCPHIGRLIDFGTTLDGGHKYLALEFVSGTDLLEATRDASHETLLNLFLQVAHAIGHLHIRGIIHGDLKPANVLVTPPHPGSTRSTGRLIDFGAARDTPEPLRLSPPCLTVPYAAPELLRTGIPTVGSDLYALGAMLHECILGVPPDALPTLAGPGDSARSGSQGTGQSAFESDLLKLAQRLLSQDPGRRPGSVEHALRALAAAALQHGVAIWSPLDRHDHLDLFPLVQREPQCALLEAVVEKISGATSPRLPVLLECSGPPGSGRSRLLRHFARLLLGRGVRVFLATTARALDSFATSTRSTTGGPWALLVDLPDEERGPSLVRLEGLLASAMAPQLLVLSRGGVLGDNAPADGLPALQRITEHHTLTIDPLSPASLLECLRVALHSRTIPSDLVDHLHSESGGSPRLSWHDLDSLINLGAVGRTLDGVSFNPPAQANQAPPAIRSLVAAGLESLPASSLTIARLLAVSRAPLPPGILSRLSGLPPEVVTAHSESLAKRGVALFSTTGEQTLRMPGLVARHVESELMSERERHDIHRQLAEAHSEGERTPQDLTVAADHYARAGLPERAFALFLRAGGELLGSGHTLEAASSYRSALSLDTGDYVTRSTAQVRLSQALDGSGLLRDACQLLQALTDDPAWPADLRLSYLLARSRCQYGLGDYRTSARDARSALRLARQHCLVSHKIEALLILGAALCWLERRRVGVKLLLKAHALARRTGQLRLAVDALRNIASSHWKSGHYRLAHRYERRRFALLSQGADPVAVSFALINMAIIQADLGHYERARHLYRRAKLVRGEKTNPNVAGAMLINLGETFRAQGRWPVVMRANRLALKRLQQSGELHRVYIGESNISRVLSSTGHFSGSRALLAHRLRLPVVQSSASIQLLYLTGWAQLFASAGSYSTAHRILSRACALAHEKQLHSLILECKAFMAFCLLSGGSYGNAIALVDKALLEHGRRSPFEALQTAKVYRLLARVRLGENLERDLQTLSKHISFLRKKSMQWHLATTLLTRAEALLALQRGSEAESSLREAAKVSGQIRDRMLYWRSQYLLGRTSEQVLRHEQALRQYRRAAHTVREIAYDIEEERIRDAFLGQPEVRDLLSRFERLRLEVGRKARHDVALLKRNEMISRKMLASLSAIGQQLNSILELDRLLASILDLAIDNVRAERGVVYLRDEGTETMHPESARGVGGQDLEDLSTFSRSVIERAAQGKTILTVDVGKDPTLSTFQSLIVHEIKSILCVPMRARGRVVGLIYLDTRKAQQMFTDKERTFVESFASQAAIAIENARLFGAMRAENTRLRREVEGRFKELIGGSAAMRRLRDTIAGILEADCTVLVTGESGTGKELVARALHYNSPRQKGPFVPVDCGALPENLLEAELFGYCRGAFTGADRDRVGLIEGSSGGTLFLDEITNTSLALQARLLRVLQEREIRRLGENQARKVDVRVIAATNADLTALMAQNRFRPDLYYRLNVVSIEVPPLRDRLEDIPVLAQHILERQAQPDRPARGLAPGVIEALSHHDWPGNVRELENALERAAILARGELITIDALPEPLRPAWRGLRVVPDREQGRLADIAFGPKTGEQAMIEDALRRFAGDKTKAARFIGWNRQKLYRRMKSYRIPADFGKAA